MKHIVIFASGGGSNAKAICKYFEHHNSIKVVAIFCNKQNAGVLDFAKQENIPTVVFNKEQWRNNNFVEEINFYKPDLIVLAGFLWLVPPYLISAYENKIINIHPSLLPKYGGKGMYGHFVHEAVIANKENESGLTIHLVNEQYDKGKILHQQKVEITHGDTAESLAKKILVQEHIGYAKTIEQYLNGLN